MDHAAEQFLAFVSFERSRHARRVRFAGLMCVLLLALLFWTKWFVIRPGLAILLAGQAGAILALLFRNRQLSGTLDDNKAGAIQQDSFLALSFLAWFEGEESFVRRLAIFESACQMIGFVVLGYAFWGATGSFSLALAIAVVYPAMMYFGITRRNNSKTIREIRAQRDEIVTTVDRLRSK